MKLNGAFEPQQGAPLIGCSIGAKKYRDKQCECVSNNNVATSGGVCANGYTSCNNNNEHTTNNNKKNIQCDNNNLNGVTTDNANITTAWIKQSHNEQPQQQRQMEQMKKTQTAIGSGFNAQEEQQHVTVNIIRTHKMNESNSNNNNNNNSNNNNNDNSNNNNNTNYNNNNKSNEKNIKANLIIDEVEKSEQQQEQQTRTITIALVGAVAIAATTTAIPQCKAIVSMLVGAITILSSLLANYKASLYCTTWFKTYSIEALMRVQQTLWTTKATTRVQATTKEISTTTTVTNIRSTTFRSRSCAVFNSKLAVAVCVSSVLILLPCCVHADESAPFDFIEVETTTPEFDYASRGKKKFGDKCENTLECGFPGSICSTKTRTCQCTDDLPITNHFDKCGKERTVNETCFFNEQCEAKYYETECRDNRCACRFEMVPIWGKDGAVECTARRDQKEPERYIDPAMIGVLVGMALMFVIICVVLRLFSQARWRENRTIFNTPNPRLMNVSLLRESKLVHGQERRGSRMSVRAPSRQPSMVSLRPHSPNPSLGKPGSASNSHGSNASATSLRSTRSNSVAPGNIGNGQQERPIVVNPPQINITPTNITTNPVAESITVEIIEVKK